MFSRPPPPPFVLFGMGNEEKKKKKRLPSAPLHLINNFSLQGRMFPRHLASPRVQGAVLLDRKMWTERQEDECTASQGEGCSCCSCEVTVSALCQHSYATTTPPLSSSSPTASHTVSSAVLSSSVCSCSSCHTTPCKCTSTPASHSRSSVPTPVYKSRWNLSSTLSFDTTTMTSISTPGRYPQGHGSLTTYSSATTPESAPRSARVGVEKTGNKEHEKLGIHPIVADENLNYCFAAAAAAALSVVITTLPPRCKDKGVGTAPVTAEMWTMTEEEPPNPLEESASVIWGLEHEAQCLREAVSQAATRMQQIERQLTFENEVRERDAISVQRQLWVHRILEKQGRKRTKLLKEAKERCEMEREDMRQVVLSAKDDASRETAHKQRLVAENSELVVKLGTAQSRSEDADRLRDRLGKVENSCFTAQREKEEQEVVFKTHEIILKDKIAKLMKALKEREDTTPSPPVPLDETVEQRFTRVHREVRGMADTVVVSPSVYLASNQA
eukprot:TRINITY_DN7576_c0_g1_i1.p1 TRINITY_DN7576_c0_g1~~TRINITY_DN7576_c0_g1_i1.p1  ORF type:complete len:500 (+),score=101.84 TRINITY_DN7576_c0_g1_i1:94-1593(+)